MKEILNLKRENKNDSDRNQIWFDFSVSLCSFFPVHILQVEGEFPSFSPRLNIIV